MTEAQGLIVAAIIAGAVAFVSVIITKEQTVSESRQDWINELRKDIAAVVAVTSGLHRESIAHVKDTKRIEEYLTQLHETIARIRLRLNPKEERRVEGPATKEVLKVLGELESAFAPKDRPRSISSLDWSPNLRELDPLLTRLVEQTQVILKENWNRVRNGETLYRIIRGLTLGLAGAGIAAAGIIWIASKLR